MEAERQTRRAGRPTLKDVAAHAGVSVSTASLTFSGRGPVAPGTAERVRAAAADLGYAGPDPIAASLRRGRADTIAVVVEGTLPLAFQDPFALSVLGGLAEALDEGGSSMLLVAHDPLAPERSREHVARAAIDAVILPLCGPRRNPLVDVLAARGIPVVGTGAPEDERVVHVLTDERAGMRCGAEHLATLGHRHVGHIAMPLGPDSPTGHLNAAELDTAQYPDSALRVRGFQDVFGVQAPIAVTSAADVPHGEAAAGLLLDAARDTPGAPALTGLVCQSDLLAAGALRAAAARGLRVPEDLSVVGFDGVDLPWLDEELTTIAQDGAGKGRALGAKALALAAGNKARTTTMPVRLRIGQTSAPPP